jgi:hypothetical protein
LEIEILPDPRLRFRAGLEMRSQSLGDTGSVSSTGLAGGWLDARYLPGPDWLLGAGAAIPFRDPSVTLQETRLVSWLQETGLQMPGSSFVLEPSIEARVSRGAAWNELYAAAAGIAVMVRLPHPAYRGGVSLDPGDRVRLAFGLDGPLAGWRGALAISGTVETVSRLDDADRYREGPRLRAEITLQRPGKYGFRCELGSYLQAQGDGGSGWPAPRGGSLWRAGVGLSWGEIWRWTASAAAWRAQGFGDLLGDSFAVRPGASLGRSFGGHRLEASIAPLFGTAAHDRSLRGVDAVLSWGLAR